MINNRINLDQAVEFADNPEPRCASILLLDTSGSMAGDPINALNQGTARFRMNLEQDPLAIKRVEIAVVTFADEARVVQDFVTPDAFNPPNLVANGKTAMGAGILKACELIDSRKKTYKQNGVAYYRPWIWLISDGAPTDDITAAIQRIQAVEAAKGALFFGVGVNGANMETLAKLSTRQPMKLDGLNFNAMFQWLSASLQAVAVSQPGDQVPLQPLGWAAI